MTVEVNPVGLRCGAKNGGLSCAFCYQAPLHGADDRIPPLDLEAVQRAVEGENDPQGFTLFGGEPLLAPVETLERLWSWGLERYKKNGVQTSGRPIRDEHFALFRKYRVAVCFSIEGPGELNDARWAGSIEETRRATAHSIACLERCLAEGISTSLITTLHRNNASAARLPQLQDWLRRLASLGLDHVNFHTLEHDGAWRRLALDHQENLAALLALRQLEVRELRGIAFQPFKDILALLRGQDAWKWKDGTSGGVSCVWTGCDPFTTPAVHGVEADGTRTLCQRVHKDRVRWQPAMRGPLMRMLALRATPQEEGGCQGCRQLITCKGQCPGTAIAGDWRKRSRDCELWKALFAHFEAVLLEAGEVPVTLRPERDEIEERMAAHWAAGRPVKVATVLEEMARRLPIAAASAAGVDHGDHTDHGDHDDAPAAVREALAGVPREKVPDGATALCADACRATHRRPQGEHICCSMTKEECEAAEPHHHDAGAQR